MGRIRRHLTYANVISTLTLFLVLGGGTALAAYVVSSNSQIGPGTISGHKPPTGKHANIIAGSINGQDIADRSGVDTCQAPLTAKYGPICVGTDGGRRDWSDSLNYCASFGLRLPSVAEAVTLAKKYDVPAVPIGGFFWTDNDSPSSGQSPVDVVTEDGNVSNTPETNAAGIVAVCVTDPSA
jgi:hypothetical protein